jgi:hypothetical protein
VFSEQWIGSTQVLTARRPRQYLRSLQTFQTSENRMGQRSRLKQTAALHNVQSSRQLRVGCRCSRSPRGGRRSNRWRRLHVYDVISAGAGEIGPKNKGIRQRHAHKNCAAKYSLPERIPGHSP